MQKAIDAMAGLAEQKLSGQKRGNGDSNALHAKRVASIVQGTVSLAGETPKAGDWELVCAALGHDLLEDSDVSEAELEQIAGSKTLAIIKELTNPEDDAHTDAYIQQMLNASEEARLIKYADLIDNTLHASYGARDLGADWMRSYFLPIIDPMAVALESTPFTSFPHTAALLRHMRMVARAHLETSISAL